ncbi:MAG: pentapeptide repeat-containing protein [Nanoarchaeota archaeon]|nr:pentapeptide repeat-containing protein [Nanoarchaeota archaeon]MBU4299614.1 pentapeptide repeat-containing protein [Nanoarchaeota archaeon]MCG2723929.1 pentapeptide repeat-containing protein [archaeon]
MVFDFVSESNDADILDKPILQKKTVHPMAKAEIVKLYGEGERDFSDILAPNSDFSGLNLSGIILTRAKLINSSFKNCKLNGADFSSAEMQDTNFEGADLGGANFSDATAFNSNFRNAKINGAKFIRANISECIFDGCDKSSADFLNAITAPLFLGRKMTAADIIKEYKQGARDFSRIFAPNSDFSGQKLSGIILRKANLHYSSFGHTDLTGADLSGAELTSCAFDSTILRNANLSKANLYWSRISGATMEGANLKESNMSWCDISGTDFSGCDISKANVQWALALKSKFSNEQFFGMSPDVLLTVRFAPTDAGCSDVKRTFSGASLKPYVVVDSGARQYVRKGENITVYSEPSSAAIGAYSPKKKDLEGYRNS